MTTTAAGWARLAALDAHVALVMLSLLAMVGCGVPKDAAGTLGRVEGGTLRVGIAHNPPWTVVASGGEPRGVEAELVHGLSGELGARIEWIDGTEGELLEALEKRDLDLVIAGLRADSPYASRLGMTKPYVRVELAVGVPADAPAPGKLSATEVAVRPHRRITAYARDAGARLVPTERPWESPGALAGYDFELEAWGRTGPRKRLAREDHVMAVPPGENAFLTRVERFLLPRADSLHPLLVREVARDVHAAR
jgi:polar amino acid transport system substrate-binding protein